MKLLDKVVLITGAGGGIGKAIAVKFSDEGAKVIVNNLELAYAESIVEKMREQGKKALAIQADVSKWPEVNSMLEHGVREFGQIDILINNAGIRKDVIFPEMSEEDWDCVISVQLKGSFNCARAAAPYMIKQNYGKIINLSSPIPAALGRSGQVNYSCACAGVEALTRTLAWELGPYNINVNCIAPDFIDTDMTRKAARRDGMYYNDLQEFVIAEIPMRRLGTPMDVANAALFLVSDESSFISGQVLYVRGGP